MFENIVKDESISATKAAPKRHGATKFSNCPAFFCDTIGRKEILIDLGE